MQNETLYQLGVGGLVAVLIVREVLQFLRWFLSRKKAGACTNPSGETLADVREDLRELVKIGRQTMTALTGLQSQTADLWRWHEPADENGVKRWWFPSRLRHVLEDLIASVKALTAEIEALKRRPVK